MTNNLDIRSQGDRRRSRAFVREFSIGIGGYAVLLAACIAIGRTSGPPVRLVLALLPLIPVVWTAVAVVRHLRQSDELQRLRTLEGLAVGFVVAMLTAVALGLLDPFGYAVPLGEWWIYSAGMLSWLVAGVVQRVR